MEFNEVLKQMRKSKRAWYNYYNKHDDEFELILDYSDGNNEEGYEVYKHLKTETYIYVNYDDGGYPEQVKLIANLSYDITHDVLDSGDKLSTLFNSTVCGEYVNDNEIMYLWFE